MSRYGMSNVTLFAWSGKDHNDVFIAQEGNVVPG